MPTLGEFPSLGAHLRALRSSAGTSLGEIASTTRISGGYLRALEADDLSELPAPVFVRGFIRAYCASLDAPADEALALYDRVSGVPPAPVGRAVVRPIRNSWLSHRLVISGVLLLLFGCGLLALKLISRPSAGRPAGLVAPAQTPLPPAPAPAPGRAADS